MAQVITNINSKKVKLTCKQLNTLILSDTDYFYLEGYITDCKATKGNFDIANPDNHKESVKVKWEII